MSNLTILNNHEIVPNKTQKEKHNFDFKQRIATRMISVLKMRTTGTLLLRRTPHPILFNYNYGEVWVNV